MKKFYVTTPIYYPSGDLHIGHAYTSTIADILARYKKELGYDVFMLTGSDEHGQKIEEVAKKNGVEPIKFVDEIVEKSFKPLFKKININYDIFMRTTYKWHEETIQKILSEMISKGDVYKGNYKGLYCVKCEAFYTKSQLEDGNICPDHKVECKEVTQESYMFKMSKYQDWILNLFETEGDKLASKEVRQELLNNFIRPGLTDLSLSRTNFKWGIPVIGDEKHVIYVWLDALFNYATALGYRVKNNDVKFDEFWTDGAEIVHIVGKDITRFHCIYWPIFLKSMDLRLPSKIITHGLIRDRDGRKMGKSLGNTINPHEFIDKYGADALRFFLAKEIPLNQDGKMSTELFESCYNTYLANKFGNLVSRTLGMIEKYFSGFIGNYETIDSECFKDLWKINNESLKKYIESMNSFNISTALDHCYNVVEAANGFVDIMTPWVLAKEESNENLLKNVLANLLNSIRLSSWMLKPIMPNTIAEVENQCGFGAFTYSSLDDYEILQTAKVKKIMNLFNRLS